MKKLNKVAMLFAAAAFVVPMAANAQAANPIAKPSAEELKYANGTEQWRNGDGAPWVSGTNDLCWRDGNWTPATAYPGCDGAAKPPPPPPPPPPPAPVAAKPAPAPVVAAKPAPTSEKVTFAADAFFEFDKATLKPEGTAKLDDLVSKMKGINLEVIIAVGHTDSVGADAYNQKLSVARSEAVKAYLVGKSIEKNRVYTEGKGEKQPVADNKTAEGRAKNRRVEIEVVGTRSK
jgi:OmpA-OmpF porin, OOP family